MAAFISAVAPRVFAVPCTYTISLVAVTTAILPPKSLSLRVRMTESPRALDSALQYTVGWIAPLFIERAAAEALFDELHAKPIDFDQPTSDPVSYTWGSIANHNIVLASLKEGMYGTTSAATLATSMLRSFPEIRFGLLVGIGGAIPREGYDIRLGDIVVSKPSGNSGGVIQYDLHKMNAGGQRERKDCLNSPPEVLLYALSNLRSRHERAPPRVSEFLQVCENKNPFMFRQRSNNPGYKHQGHTNDRLFQSTYEHTGTSDCRNCASEQEVKRDPRDHTDPEIHYGVIASGNTLVKDTSAREDLIRHIPEDCICYEMEAAGLMNSFPCLVIRGISDYSDSHKNDRWQRYAAATSAAFAKELLGYVSIDRVSREPKAIDVLEQLSNLHETMRVIDEKFTNARDKDLERNIMKWLSPPDTSAIHCRAQEEKHTGSCNWFLQSRIFHDWKRTPAGFLWLHGLPGSGKTILSSAIIQNLTAIAKDSKIPVLYFYFDINDPSSHSLAALARALIYQLYCLSEDARPELGSLYESCINGTAQPETKSMLKVLLSMAKRVGNVRIVLDALDEVKDCHHRQKILSWIANLNDSKTRHFSLIALSRRENDIKIALERFQTVPIVPEDVDRDIQEYVETRFEIIQVSKRWIIPSEVLQDIKSTLKKANGMFRLVACQLDSLQRCFDLRALEIALKNLPQTLTEMYDRILEQIPKEQEDSAIRLLQILAYSRIPLHHNAVADALAVNLNRTPAFHPKYKPWEPESLAQYCPSLVVVVEGGPDERREDFDIRHRPKRVLLAHFSVTEYLRSGPVIERFHKIGRAHV